MTKAEVVSEIATKTGVGKEQTLAVVEKLFEVIQKNMSEGKEIHFRGFGNFKFKNKAEKKARNISKNTEITIPAYTAPCFKPSDEFVEKIKKSNIESKS